jgi:3'-phosphoadenosine 5'-phosphosulfate (PAPS) 3'-phosphatase
MRVALIEAGSPLLGIAHAPALSRTYYGIETADLSYLTANLDKEPSDHNHRLAAGDHSRQRFSETWSKSCSSGSR